MRGIVVWLILLLIAVTIFAISNTVLVTVTFLQWTLYTGPLALAIVGAGVLGALLTFVSSLGRHGHLSSRIRELERRLREHDARPDEGAAGAPPRTALDEREGTRRIV
jgi:uncharacterized integral membrane protein